MILIPTLRRKKVRRRGKASAFSSLDRIDIPCCMLPIMNTFIKFNRSLDASSHLYMRICLPVCWSVNPWCLAKTWSNNRAQGLLSRIIFTGSFLKLLFVPITIDMQLMPDQQIAPSMHPRTHPLMTPSMNNAPKRKNAAIMNVVASSQNWEFEPESQKLQCRTEI